MSAPAIWAAGTRQLLTSRPSIITEHAPHSPSPQPSFVPVSCNCSRSTSSKRSIGNTSTLLGSELTVNRISSLSDNGFSLVSCQLSVVSCQLSVVSCQLSVVSCQLSVVSCQLSVVSCQLNTPAATR